MAGIYVHIPFCKQICHYCDFHKEILHSAPDDLIHAICCEIEIQKDYLHGERINTIYLGGGTPSVLDEEQIKRILNTIEKFNNVDDKAEISIETNPDDLDIQYLRKLRDHKINRISIGVQSFSDEELKTLNRRHNAGQAFNAVTMAQKAGFKNVNIDLIYGVPGTDNGSWRENIKKALELPITHISAYHLTIEPGTEFASQLKKGKIKLMEEEKSVEQFRELVKQLESNGFLHYEISNFCKENYFSKHNTNYWRQQKYLGLGPSSHSFNGNSRQWNSSDNEKYIESIKRKKIPCNKEVLDEKTMYNEYILTSLRTMWGTDLKYIEETFNKEARDYCVSLSNRFIDYGMLERNGENLVLTQQGKFVSDNIISELLMVS
jgi:oxygen-independent coproporphyrinogen-3 oxidase